MKLSDRQIKYLQYLVDNHDGLGWPTSIKKVIEDGQYPTTGTHMRFSMVLVLDRWYRMVRYTTAYHESGKAEVANFGTPKRYLKFE